MSVQRQERIQNSVQYGQKWLASAIANRSDSERVLANSREEYEASNAFLLADDVTRDLNGRAIDEAERLVRLTASRYIGATREAARWMPFGAAIQTRSWRAANDAANAADAAGYAFNALHESIDAAAGEDDDRAAETALLFLICQEEVRVEMNLASASRWRTKATATADPTKRARANATATRYDDRATVHQSVLAGLEAELSQLSGARDDD
jgi:hypothetical protein